MPNRVKIAMEVPLSEATQGFYVTMIRGKRVAFLAGPYPCKGDAERACPSAGALARKLDPWADFDSFGVTMLKPPRRFGFFNHMLRNNCRTPRDC